MASAIPAFCLQLAVGAAVELGLGEVEQKKLVRFIHDAYKKGRHDQQKEDLDAATPRNLD